MRKPLTRALSELALIFAGITLALTFENWNDDRVERAQERELLVALAADLEETLGDLRRDIRVSEGTLESRALILAWQNGQDMPDSILAMAFAETRGESGLFPKVSAYESIKTIGLDLISDATLRADISSLHELTLVRARRFEEDRDRFDVEVLLPLIRRNLEYVGSGGVSEVERQVGSYAMAPLDLLRPIDPSRLRASPEFEIVVRESYNWESAALDAYRRLESETERVNEAVREWLVR